VDPLALRLRGKGSAGRDDGGSAGALESPHVRPRRSRKVDKSRAAELRLVSPHTGAGRQVKMAKLEKLIMPLFGGRVMKRDGNGWIWSRGSAGAGSVSVRSGEMIEVGIHPSHEPENDFHVTVCVGGLLLFEDWKKTEELAARWAAPQQTFDVLPMARVRVRGTREQVYKVHEWCEQANKARRLTYAGSQPAAVMGTSGAYGGEDARQWGVSFSLVLEQVNQLRAFLQLIGLTEET